MQIHGAKSFVQKLIKNLISCEYPFSHWFGEVVLQIICMQISITMWCPFREGFDAKKRKRKKKCNLLLCLLRISAQSVYTALCTLTVTKGNLSR